ncbi:MAG: GspH/FimT family pseudopilin [Xanthomonadales bacterium]|nr:GspH/FimT family pseudopilin [Xanthomonadales bacterium]
MKVNRIQGFTVIELMITMAVLVILLAVAVPSFRAVIQSNRVTASTNQLLTALNFARSEAVKRGQVVSLCMADTSSPPKCQTGGGDDWANGWLAFLNPSGSASYSSYSDDVLRVWDPLPDDIELEVNDTDVAETRRVDYQPMGNVDTDGTSFQFQWVVKPADCKTGQPYQRTIDISAAGRAQVRDEKCS